MTRPTPPPNLPYGPAATGPSQQPNSRSAGKKGSRSSETAVPQLLDMTEVAALMATSVRHIRRLVTERRIPYLKVGRFVRFDPEILSVWLEERRVDVYVPVARRRPGRL